MGVGELFTKPAHCRWGLRLVLAVTVCGGLAYVPYGVVGGPTAEHLQEMRTELQRTRSQARTLRQRNREQRQLVDSLKNDPGAVEDIARSDLGMAYPHEVLYRLTEESER